MFTDTMQRWLENVRDNTSRFSLTRLFYPLYDRESTSPVNSAGLVIYGAGGTVPKIGSSDFYAFIQGVLVKKAASTDMPALSGTVVNATFNVFCFFMDQSGTLTSVMGTAGSTLAKVVFPQFPEGKVLVGFVIINPTGTGNFVGGTTALDDATVVPNAVYQSPSGSFDPYCLTGLATTP